MEDHCVMCGEVVPEGTQVCPNCIEKYGNKAENVVRVYGYTDSSISSDKVLYTYRV